MQTFIIFLRHWSPNEDKHPGKCINNLMTDVLFVRIRLMIILISQGQYVGRSVMFYKRTSLTEWLTRRAKNEDLAK